jgi:hypothetical protein
LENSSVHKDFLSNLGYSKTGEGECEDDLDWDGSTGSDREPDTMETNDGHDSVSGSGSSGTGSSCQLLDQRCSLRRAARYLSNALYLVRLNKSRITSTTGDRGQTIMSGLGSTSL